MEKKTARRWLIRNKSRLYKYGMKDKDKRQVEKCFKALGIKVKAKDNIITENIGKPQP